MWEGLGMDGRGQDSGLCDVAGKVWGLVGDRERKMLDAGSC